MEPLASASWSYTEYAQLPAAVRDDAQGLEDAARHFESLFINMWLKSAREANAVLAKDSFFSSNEMEMQQQMFDSQMAMHLAKEGGVGLAPTIVRQLGGARAVEPGVTPAAVAPLSVPAQRLSDPALKESATRPIHDISIAEPRVSGTRASKFEDHESFLQTLAPRIKRIVGAAGLPALAVMAQAALETGWGKSVIEGADGESSHNLFGLKDTNWTGPTVEIHSKEFLFGGWHDKLAGFRAYPDWDAGIADYVRSITQSNRYAAVTESHLDPPAYAEFLQQAGYATDPNYAQKLKGVMQRLTGLGF